MPAVHLSTEKEAKVVQIRGFVTPLLSFLPRSIPDYTDHGVIHSENLSHLLENFQENLQDESFNQEELFIFQISIWLHDVGCILCKQKEKPIHHEKSALLLDSNPFRFVRDLIDPDFLACAKYVILAHQHSFSFKDLPQTNIHYKVRLPMICAIFRLIDACDISRARVRPIVYDILNDHNLIDKESKKWWEAHINITSVVFNKGYIDVAVKDEIKAKVLINHLRRDLRSINRELEQLDNYRGWKKFKIRVQRL